MWRPLQGQRPGELVERRLAGVVRRHAWDRLDGQVRGHVDNRRPLPLLKHPSELAAEEKRAANVDCKGLVPELGPGLIEGRHGRHSGIIDETVERSPTIRGFLGEPANRIRIGDICHPSPGRAAELFDSGRQGLGRSCNQPDLGPTVDQSPRRLEANTTRRPRNNHSLAA